MMYMRYNFALKAHIYYKWGIHIFWVFEYQNSNPDALAGNQRKSIPECSFNVGYA